MPPTDTLLSVLPAAGPKDRLAVFLCHREGSSHLELRQQSWGDGVGWFTQSSVRIDRSQLNGLRSALGVVRGAAPQAARPASDREHAVLAFPGRDVG